MNLMETLQEYVYETRVYEDMEVRKRLHELKHHASQYLLKAESLYYQYMNSTSDESLLGQVAMQCDLFISSIHKVLIEYTVPK